MRIGKNKVRAVIVKARSVGVRQARFLRVSQLLNLRTFSTTVVVIPKLLSRLSLSIEMNDCS